METGEDYSPNNATRRVFNASQEKELCSYAIRSAKWCFGLTPSDLRKLALQFAKKLGLAYPVKWDEDGEMWYRTFRHRFINQLSLRKPEATSLGRMACFNKSNVENFYEKLTDVYNRQEWTPYNIWNVDETGCSSVHKPLRVLAALKDKQVSGASSAERGYNVTMVSCISAAGTFVPPALIFPRVNYKPHMINGAPAETLGLATASGW